VAGVHGGGGRSGNWFGHIVLGEFQGKADGEGDNLGEGEQRTLSQSWWSKRYEAQTSVEIECEQKCGTWSSWRQVVDPGFLEIQILGDVGQGEARRVGVRVG